MWQVYIFGGAVIIVSFCVATIAFLARREGRLVERTAEYKEAAKDAEIIAEIATNDKPSNVDQRLRDGTF